MMAMIDFDALGGQDTEDGRTVFSKEGGGNKVGETITPLPFTLYSDPYEAGLECTPFVATGARLGGFGLRQRPSQPAHRLAARRRAGRLRYHRAGAAKSGREMATYIDNLVLQCGDHDGGSIDEMVARTENGLLLTCLWYIRPVDPATLLMTGLTRDGVYVIEDGASSVRPTTSASTRAQWICWCAPPRSAHPFARSAASSASTSIARSCPHCAFLTST